MKLKIKEEYKEYSIGGGRVNTIKLKNMDPSLYEFYYKNGYKEFFEEVNTNIPKKGKSSLEPIKGENNDIEDDTNK